MDIVRNWMSSPPITATEDLSLADARALLRARRVRRLPVVDAQGRLVGIVTEGDIHSISASHVTDVQEYSLYHRAGQVPLREIMRREVITVTPETMVLEVARIMVDRKIGGIPVIEDGVVVGIITESDLFRTIIANETRKT